MQDRGSATAAVCNFCLRICGRLSGRPGHETMTEMPPVERTAMAQRGGSLQPPAAAPSGGGGGGGGGASRASADGVPPIVAAVCRQNRITSDAGGKCTDCDGWGYVHPESDGEEHPHDIEQRCAHCTDCPSCDGAGVIRSSPRSSALNSARCRRRGTLVSPRLAQLEETGTHPPTRPM
eukprot:TRINITY_DN20554_c0_g1_i1.p2 TRINITY_DN20554_c0_g1~~TRINITY_DN20554_c0_g1_i1.p2  ORF type:complete len:178 (-),score=23.35 TRINITY_DN20554_c0_g1_i1:56-589(-)